MEPLQLSRFYEQVTVWPKSASEMDAAAEGIFGLFDSTFVALSCNRVTDGAGPKPSGMGLKLKESSEILDREGISNSIRDLLKKSLGDATATLRRIQVTNSNLPSPLLANTTHLTYFRLFDIQSRTRKDYGFLVVGSAVPFPAMDEALMLSVAQKLTDLAKIAELDSAVGIRNQFLSIASHELKTPLTSIYGILQLQERMLRLRKDQAPFPDQERHHNFLKMVIRQVQRLNELIDGLLDVSRIQNGRFAVEPTDTDVAVLLGESVQARLNVIAQEAGVKLQLESLPHLNARVDPVRMEEVISNLVMNAIRFSPEGGVVWVKLREDEDSFRLVVRDQGPSIALEDRERIFQPFERAQRTARMGGLGLGLFISRQIAQLHGGNVSLVESVPGKGNVFEACFPIRSSQLASTA